MLPRFEVRRGVTRTVLLVGRWAVKVPSLRAHHRGLRGVLWSVCHGILANLSEADWSGMQGVCPVHWSLAGLINVYPRCEPASEELTDDVYEAIGFVGGVDKKPANLGWLNGKLVWFDYDQSGRAGLSCHHRGGGRA